MKQPEHTTIFGEAMLGVSTKEHKGRAKRHKTERRGPRLAIALELAERYRDREREFRKQHGKVRIIVKDGKPVCD